MRLIFGPFWSSIPRRLQDRLADLAVAAHEEHKIVVFAKSHQVDA